MAGRAVRLMIAHPNVWRHDAGMSRRYRKSVSEARSRLRSDPCDEKARSDLYEAERRLAEAQGEQWAETVDIGARWSAGAPLPHLVSNGSTTIVICFAAVSDPSWDGTHVRMVSPTDDAPSALLHIEFSQCQSIKFGGPNNEAMNGHPLYGRGIEPYAAHVVHNSQWLEQARLINSVHPYHSDESYVQLNHYLLAFHDETFEALAQSITTRRIEGVFGQIVVEAAHEIVQR